MKISHKLSAVLLLILTNLFLYSCAASPGEDGDSAGTSAPRRSNLSEMTLYFRNRKYQPHELEIEDIVVPVKRQVQYYDNTPLKAIQELVQGPSDREIDEFGAAPVIRKDTRIL